MPIYGLDNKYGFEHDDFMRTTQNNYKSGNKFCSNSAKNTLEMRTKNTLEMRTKNTLEMRTKNTLEDQLASKMQQ